MAVDTLGPFGAETSDERLGALSAAGSERAFAALVERYREPLARYCRRLGVDHDGVDDVVQQTFVSAWSALQAGTRVEAVRAWLYRIARHQAIDRHRRRRPDVVPLPETLAEPIGDLGVDIATTLHELRALPENQRRALLGTAVHGRSHHEVADELGLSDTAVRGLVFRARAALRTAVGALVPAPVIVLARRLGMVAELSGGGVGGDLPAAAKVLAVTVCTGVLAGGAGVAIHTSARPPDRAAGAAAPHHAAVPPTPVARAAPARHATVRTAAEHRGQHARRERGGAAASTPVSSRPAGDGTPSGRPADRPHRDAPVPSSAAPAEVPASSSPGPAAPGDRAGHGADDPAPSSGGHGADDATAAAAPDDHGGSTTTTATPAPSPPAAAADDSATAQPPSGDDHGGGRH